MRDPGLKQPFGPPVSYVMTSPSRVVVVDDSEVVLEMTADVMREAGLDPIAVSDVRRVSATIASHRPALVLVDLTMQELSGEQVVARILDEFGDEGFPVLLFSGHADSELLAAAERCGADGIVIKGGGDHAFVKEVKRWIALAASP